MKKLYTVRTETGYMEMCSYYELAVALANEIYNQTGVGSEITVVTAEEIDKIINEKRTEIEGYYEEINYMWTRGQVMLASFHRELAELLDDLDKWIEYRYEQA